MISRPPALHSILDDTANRGGPGRQAPTLCDLPACSALVGAARVSKRAVFRVGSPCQVAFPSDIQGHGMCLYQLKIHMVIYYACTCSKDPRWLLRRLRCAVCRVCVVPGNIRPRVSGKGSGQADMCVVGCRHCCRSLLHVSVLPNNIPSMHVYNRMASRSVHTNIYTYIA